MISLILLAIASTFYNIYKEIKRTFILKSSPANFKGKTIWITGASSGIGEMLAYRFADLGANLVLTARSIQRLELVKLKCNELNKNSFIHIVPFDLSKPLEARGFVEQYLNFIGNRQINILVHNADVGQRCKFLDFPYQNHEYIFNLNFNGPFAITQPIIAHMIKHNTRNSKNDAQIVLIQNMAAKINFGLKSSYSATKSALTSLFDSIRVELRESNIKITQIFHDTFNSNSDKNALIEKIGQSQGIQADEIKNNMGLDVFINQAIDCIYMEELEQMIVTNKYNYITTILKQVFPGLLTKILNRIYIKTAVKQKIN